MASRRQWMIGALLGAAGLPAVAANDSAQRRFVELEGRHGGRLGVAILDTASGRSVVHRGDERFPLCSTFKFLAAALVLSRVDRDDESLARRIAYRTSDLVPYSPITGKHDDMAVGELCEAAVTVSDNTAANLLLDSFGRPAGLTAYARSLGDGKTRLDRREPDLNEATPGDPRDTTTPAAMLGLLRSVVVGNALSDASRTQLTTWMVATKTGDARLRAGLPKGWRVGDKTGSGAHATTNDIAVVWPPARSPIIVSCYFTASNATGDQRDAVLAAVGRMAADLVS